MKKFKFIIAFSILTVSSISLVSAQTEKPVDAPVAIPESYQETQKSMESDSTVSNENVNIPESYQSEQEQIESEASGGTSTYTLDESIPPAETGAAEWRGDGDVEELKVYSGSHDGTNYIKTIEVKIPAKSQYSSSEYIPK